MRKEPLAMILTADLAAKARGRAATQQELHSYLVSGCGWVPANLAIDPFGRIITPNPFGSVGDLKLIPDASSLSQMVANPGEEATTLVMGDLVNPDGTPWENCPRTFLKNAIADLKAETGLSVTSSFEHEFMLREDAGSPVNTPFSLQAFLEQEPMGGQVMAALADAGLEPEMWLPEFGRNQFEVTLKPAGALAAADRAIYLREIVRNVVRTLGSTATFSPIIEENGGGNGVHVHVSLTDENGDFVTYDPSRPGKISEVAGSFAAGVLAHADAIQVLAASSVVSYERLAPNRWSVGGVFLGENNREALLRICPLFHTPGANHAKQYNLEYRGADITSNPWIVLGAIIRAGLEGIRQQLPTPPVVSGELSGFSAEELAEYQVGRTPVDLSEALDFFEASPTVRGWFAEDFVTTFLAVKRSEVDTVAAMSDAERYDAYATTY